MDKAALRALRDRFEGLFQGTAWSDALLRTRDRGESLEQLAQKRWAYELSRTVTTPAELPSFEEVGFKCYSQNDEDGVLLFLFALVDAETRTVVEIGAGDGTECNSTNLIINHGWRGWLFEGNRSSVRAGRRFFRQHPRTHLWPPRFCHAWLTRENVNTLVTEQALKGEIDLLSLDLDGNDFWIWQSLTCLEPRVVVLAINPLWGAERSVSIPYDPRFEAELSHGGSDYAGASLPAFVDLGRKKGYRLVGCEKYGTHAFFMREDVGMLLFPEVPAADCLRHPRARHALEHRLPLVRGRAWEEV